MKDNIKNLKVFGPLRMRSGEGNALWHLPSLLLCFLAVTAALMTGCADEVEMYDAGGKAGEIEVDAGGKAGEIEVDATGGNGADVEDTETIANPGETAEGKDGKPTSEDSTAKGSNAGTETTETIMVHMCGAVADPGVYELEKESRIVDGVRCAGGFTEEADEDAINLSKVLVDQVRVYIPTRAETESYAAAYELTGTYGDLSGSVAGASAGGLYGAAGSELSDVEGDERSGEGSGLININTANIEKLEQIPGIGVSKAKSIVDYREKNGAFKSIEDIKKVSGIGDATFENMKDMITVN